MSVSISSTPCHSGVTCTLNPWLTANSWLFGSRAAIQIGGPPSWSGLGEAVVAGKR